MWLLLGRDFSQGNCSAIVMVLLSSDIQGFSESHPQLHKTAVRSIFSPSLPPSLPPLPACPQCGGVYLLSSQATTSFVSLLDLLPDLSVCLVLFTIIAVYFYKKCSSPVNWLSSYPTDWKTSILWFKLKLRWWGGFGDVQYFTSFASQLQLELIVSAAD